MKVGRVRMGSANGRRRGGFTMLELMVAIAIIVALVSLVVLGARAAQNFSRKSNAQQQIKLIANAIDAYSTFWPRWTVGNVVVAEKGWPDFSGGRLFAETGLGGPFPPDPGGFNTSVTHDNDGGNSGITYDAAGEMVVTEGDVEHAGECLTFALSSSSGKGPYIKDEMKGDLQIVHETELYPTLSGANATPRSEFVDPWGTPYRYFWVYRDPVGPQGGGKGLLPVNYAAFRPGSVVGGVNTLGATGFQFTYNTQTLPKTAVGYVLESAGPDKRFGNVWKANPTQKEIEDAADNLVAP